MVGCWSGAIPCNTAHAPQIFDRIQAGLKECGSRIKLLHMIEEVVLFLSTTLAPTTGVGLLATLGSYQVDVYSEILHRNGFVCITPDAAGCNEVHDAIYSRQYGVKANGPTAAARDAVCQVMAQLRAKGATAIILGCTELPILLKSRALLHLPLIDPTLILARAAIREAAPDRLIPWEDL